MENQRKKPNWLKLYSIISTITIVVILFQLFSGQHLSLYIVLLFAAQLIVGLLDSVDNNRFKENKVRHILDAVILILFVFLFYVGR